jgi:N,N-dimethylformamidase
MPETHKPLDIVGYSHVISARPGETVPLRVSCSPESSEYRVDLVRLRSGDTEPGGPGLKEEVIETNLSGRTLHGYEQTTTPGSYGYVRHAPSLALDGSPSLCAFIYPTALAGHVQALIAKWNASRGSGYALVVDEAARLQLWRGGDSHPMTQLGDGEPLVQDCWYYVSASYDRAHDNDVSRLTENVLARFLSMRQQ